MQRRTFVHALGASIGAAALSRPLAASGSRTRLERIGLELYSVRDAMRRDPERTLAAVRRIGYTDVELLWSFGNFGRTTEQVRASLAAEGLRAPSAHIAPGILLTNWEQSLETAKVLGHDYLIVPSLPEETRHSLDAWRRWADHFNTAGSAARKAGIWLAFHNEPDHMPPIDGVVPYDVFVERTDPQLVRLQLDVGNMTMGGGDPMRYLARHAARYTSFHLKDIAAGGKSDTELGKGTFDLRRFLAAVPDVNRKPCLVEQEGSADSLASAGVNYNYLKSLEF